MTQHERDPIRLLDAASEADDRVRRCLTAGRDEAPTEAQLAALAARLGPLLGPGGAGPGPGGGVTGAGGSAGGAAGGALFGSVAGKLAAAAVVAAVVVGGGVWVRSRAAPREEPVVIATPAPPAPPARVDDGPPPRGLDPAELRPAEAPALATPTSAHDGSRSQPRATPPDAGTPDAGAPPADPDAELALVRSAQDALAAGDAGRALALSSDHARRFAAGVLAQEREVVAIGALVRLGRAEQARARGDAFRRRWPRSAHLRRIDVLLGTPSQP